MSAAPSSTPSSPSPASGGRDPYAAFRSYAYRAYTIGWFVSTLGVRIQSFAITWDMYQRTGDAWSLGLVGLVQALPTMLLALPAGYLADRFNRAKLVMLSLVLMTLSSTALAVLSYNHGSVGFMYIFLALDAAAVIVGRPARVAMMPQLVPVEAFPNAVMWNTSMMQFTSVVGPALGALVVAWNVPVSYVIAAASSLVYLLMVAGLKLPPESKPIGTASFKGLVEGMQFVWNKRIIFTMISLDMFAVLLGGAVYLLPIFAQDILNVGVQGLAWLRIAPAVGALLLGVGMVYLPPIKRAGRMLLVCIAGFGAATIVFGLSRNLWLSVAMLALTGAFDYVSMIIRQTVLQLLTPSDMRGRVSAVSSIFVGASNELGGFESGSVAQLFGPVFSVVSGGIGTILVVIAAGWLSPQLRRYGPLVADSPVPVIVPPEPVSTNIPTNSSAPIASTLTPSMPTTSVGASVAGSDD